MVKFWVDADSLPGVSFLIDYFIKMQIYGSHRISITMKMVGKNKSIAGLSLSYLNSVADVQTLE